MGNIAGLRAGQVPPELGRVGYGDTPSPAHHRHQAGQASWAQHSLH